MEATLNYECGRDVIDKALKLAGYDCSRMLGSDFIQAFETYKTQLGNCCEGITCGELLRDMYERIWKGYELNSCELSKFGAQLMAVHNIFRHNIFALADGNRLVELKLEVIESFASAGEPCPALAMMDDVLYITPMEDNVSGEEECDKTVDALMASIFMHDDIDQRICFACSIKEGGDA